MYLHHITAGARVPLGNFYKHPKDDFGGEWRVDTHPRYSPDGRFVCIDSPHDGPGRQIYVLDIRGVVGGKKW